MMKPHINNNTNIHKKMAIFIQTMHISSNSNHFRWFLDNRIDEETMKCSFFFISTSRFDDKLPQKHVGGPVDDSFEISTTQLAREATSRVTQVMVAFLNTLIMRKHPSREHTALLLLPLATHKRSSKVRRRSTNQS